MFGGEGMSDVFIEAAKKVGWDCPNGTSLVITPTLCLNERNPGEFAVLKQLLMLAVLEKMGWGIDYYPKTAAPGWWFGSLEFEAQGPFAFSDLPVTVCKAFVEAKR